MATLTIRDADDKLLDKLKDFTEHKTASKAVMLAAERSLVLDEMLADKVAEHEKLLDRYEAILQTLDQLSGLCIKVNEIAGQRDLEL